MKLLPILFLLLAAEFKPKLQSVVYQKQEVLVGCNNLKNCKALDAIKSVSSKQYQGIKKFVFGGKTVGDQFCLKIHQAEIIYHYDKDKNEEHFCLFSDKSYLSTGYFDLFVNLLEN